VKWRRTVSPCRTTKIRGKRVGLGIIVEEAKVDASGSGRRRDEQEKPAGGFEI